LGPFDDIAHGGTFAANIHVGVHDDLCVVLAA
jgi:hypothetical protein